MNFRSAITLNPLHFTTEYCSKLIADIADKSAKARENILMEQLNDFISRGLIEVETSEFVLIRRSEDELLELRQSVKLKLKDKEYIEKLEEIQKKYNQLVQMIKDGAL